VVRLAVRVHDPSTQPLRFPFPFFAFCLIRPVRIGCLWQQTHDFRAPRVIVFLGLDDRFVGLFRRQGLRWSGWRKVGLLPCGNGFLVDPCLAGIEFLIPKLS
jgi:hypothetical protein